MAAESEELPGLLLRGPEQIHGLLHRLRLNRCLLSIRPYGSDRAYSSIVLAINVPRGAMDIDALHPAPPEAVPAQTSLSVRSCLDGGDLRFRAHSLASVMHEGAPALRVALPEDVFVLERRAAYRVRVPALPPSSVGRVLPDQDARLTDISQLGAGAVVPHRLEPGRGDRLRLQLRLPGAVIETDADVRTTRRQADGVRVGLCFAPLQGDARHRLSQAINRLERELIRSSRTLR